MIAIILAGGKGTRLRPITYEIPKSLIPIKGKPIIHHILCLFKQYNITDIIISVGYLKERVKEYFKSNDYGMNITFLEENEPLGTAGPLKLLKDKKCLPKETFIVCNGDELKEINIDDMVRFHKENKALITIALTSVDDPSSYGVAKMDGNKIIEFIEKPKKEEAPSNLINSGFYVMEPETIDLIPNGFSMLERSVFPKVANTGRLFGYPFNGQWFPTDTIERIKIAEENWTPLDI